jgi:MFS family permease
VTAPWQLYLAYVLIAFGWAGTSLAAINNTLGLWFDKRRGMAISLALNGASCGGVFGVLLVGAIGKFGFSATLIGAALVIVVIAVPAILIWVGQPPRRAPPPPMHSRQNRRLWLGPSRRYAVRRFAVSHSGPSRCRSRC